MMMTTTQKTMRRTVLLLAAMLLALVFFSGAALAVTKSCEALVECFGTKRADTLNGSEGNDFMYGKGRGDTLKGVGGHDRLYGQGGADKLFGGLGDDGLFGGPGNDALNGGEDSDYYRFGPNWGKDSITDSDLLGGISFYEYSTNGDYVLVNDNLTIKLQSGDGPEATNASGTSTINWEGNVINDVYPGSGDDQITGKSSSNEIHADQFGGADNISTGAGNDYIDVADGLGDDVVDCGENGGSPDSDHVYFDSGDQIAGNCEILN